MTAQHKICFYCSLHFIPMTAKNIEKTACSQTCKNTFQLLQLQLLSFLTSVGSKQEETYIFFLKIRIHLYDFNSCLLHHTGKHHTCEYLMQLKNLTCTTRVALIVVKMFKVMFCLACHMIKEDIFMWIFNAASSFWRGGQEISSGKKSFVLDLYCPWIASSPQTKNDNSLNSQSGSMLTNLMRF